ncbi:Fc.00g048580.m01.CDS01 [Cosmosporella sp. VM-42]
MSGAVISVPDKRRGNSISTIGCVLQIDSKFYGVTAAHALHKADEAIFLNSKIDLPHGMIPLVDEMAQETRQPVSNSVTGVPRTDPLDDQSSVASDEGMAESAYTTQTSIPDSELDQLSENDVDFVDDVEYDTLTENGEGAWQELAVLGFRDMPLDDEPINSIAVLPPDKCSAACAYCKVPDNDWALVKLSATEHQLPNAFFNVNCMSQPIFFSSIPGGLPKEEREVLIVASNQRVLKGLLQPISCLLGGITRNEQAEYWTVVLSSGEELIRGDSGSIVIDAGSQAIVYGHVVALNPMGEVYISPLAATMSQVKGLLFTTHVALPEPLPLLTGLASYHLRKGNDYAFELLSYLDGLIQATQQTSDWSPLVSWALSHQRDGLLESVKKGLQVTQDPKKVRILQKFSPDHSEKVLGSEIMMSVDAESTYLSTALKSGTSVAMSATTDDSDYDFDNILSPNQEAIDELEGTWRAKTWSGDRSRPDGNDPDTNAVPDIPVRETDIQHNATGHNVKDQFPFNHQVVDRSQAMGALERAGFPVDRSHGDDNEINHIQRGIEHEDSSPRLRRPSLDIDYGYYEVLALQSSQPPRYELAMKDQKIEHRSDEVLPGYSCDINLEGVFSLKMEIENTFKRAEDRQWHTMYVVLRGTALYVYEAKKSWGWHKGTGPEVHPDKPPWVKQGTLWKYYNLQYADVGIAADYRKRRYVIRIRAETDQFLLSSVELETFIEWLDGLNAAINVALPIEYRDYPRDSSIPRIQRIRSSRSKDQLESEDDLGPPVTETAASIRVSMDGNVSRDSQGLILNESDAQDGPSTHQDPAEGPSSSRSPPNESINPDTGKWAPEHRWSSAHDYLYAKLCYSTLLYASPRKSNYVISQGKLWFVDWTIGRMRVLPPTYEPVERFGPWQVVQPMNSQI